MHQKSMRFQTKEHPMIGFQSPALSLELAKAVRAADLAAAQRFRLGRLARRHDSAKNRAGLASPAQAARSAARGIGAPRRSSG
jgi:hypothetical protein